jgi:hypothetical protein
MEGRERESDDLVRCLWEISLPLSHTWNIPSQLVRVGFDIHAALNKQKRARRAASHGGTNILNTSNIDHHKTNKRDTHDHGREQGSTLFHTQQRSTKTRPPVTSTQKFPSHTERTSTKSTHPQRFQPYPSYCSNAFALASMIYCCCGCC